LTRLILSLALMTVIKNLGRHTSSQKIPVRSVCLRSGRIEYRSPYPRASPSRCDRHTHRRSLRPESGLRKSAASRWRCLPVECGVHCEILAALGCEVSYTTRGGAAQCAGRRERRRVAERAARRERHRVAEEAMWGDRASGVGRQWKLCRSDGASVLVSSVKPLGGAPSGRHGWEQKKYGVEAAMNGSRRSSVGDSHKGPLNNQEETRLKPAKNAKHKSTRTPKTHTQHNHDPGGPRGTPGQHSGRPSSEVRLARGIDAPSGEVRLARRLDPAPRARPPSLEG
jgi:hypothetical protein